MPYVLTDKKMRSDRIEAELNRIIKKIKSLDVKKVILFGSSARGDINSKSDIDLLIVKESEMPFLSRLEEIYAAIEPTMAIDILVYTPKEFDELKGSSSFVSRAVEEGKVLYEA